MKIFCIFISVLKLFILTTSVFLEPWVACASSPCENGGSCIDVNVDTFVCMCRDGYYGDTCQYSTLLTMNSIKSNVKYFQIISYDIQKRLFQLLRKRVAVHQ